MLGKSVDWHSPSSVDTELPSDLSFTTFGRKGHLLTIIEEKSWTLFVLISTLATSVVRSKRKKMYTIELIESLSLQARETVTHHFFCNEHPFAGKRNPSKTDRRRRHRLLLPLLHPLSDLSFASHRANRDESNGFYDLCLRLNGTRRKHLRNEKFQGDASSLDKNLGRRERWTHKNAIRSLLIETNCRRLIRVFARCNRNRKKMTHVPLTERVNHWNSPMFSFVVCSLWRIRCACLKERVVKTESSRKTNYHFKRQANEPERTSHRAR